MIKNVKCIFSNKKEGKLSKKPSLFILPKYMKTLLLYINIFHTGPVGDSTCFSKFHCGKHADSVSLRVDHAVPEHLCLPHFLQ